MCKIVYLTSERFDKHANVFKRALAKELTKRKVEVRLRYSWGIFNIFRRKKRYGIALAFDFYKDGKQGRGITLNDNCTYIGREFAYNLSSNLDISAPDIKWRDFKFIDSNSKEWKKYFYNISATTRAILYLSSVNNEHDWLNYSITFEKTVRLFADEIVRCLRSEYNVDKYRKSVMAAKSRVGKYEIKRY